MIQFYLKSAKAPHYLVMMRIYDAQFKDGVFNYSTREKVLLKEWDQKNGCPKGNTALTKVLLEFETDASEFMRSNKKTGYTRESLRDHLNGTYQQQPVVLEEETIIDQWKTYHKSREGTVSAGTLNNYKNAMGAFQSFVDDKGLYIRPSQFDLTMYRKYLVFLKEKFAENTSAKYLKTFKMFIDEAGIKLPFDAEKVIKFKETPGVQIALTEEELDKLRHHKFEDKLLNDVRWLFILQCYTGLRISDFRRIGDKVVDNFIRIETKKVKGIRIEQPLTEIPREIFKRYKGVLPKMDDTQYRWGIKEIYKAIAPHKTIEVRTKDGNFKTVAVHTEISTHDAVRTFVTTLCANRGISVNSIAKLVGKSVGVILNRYLVSSMEVAHKEMIDKFNTAPATKSKPKKRISQNTTLSLGL